MIMLFIVMCVNKGCFRKLSVLFFKILNITFPYHILHHIKQICKKNLFLYQPDKTKNIWRTSSPDELTPIKYRWE